MTTHATHDTTTAADNAGKASAQIIPFPAKAAAPGKADPRAQDPQERLTRALASLDSALSEQRAAMSGWRESLDHLRKATTGLGLSMQRYHRTLGKLGADVSDLHAEALRLERWADDTLARTAAQTTAQSVVSPGMTVGATPAGGVKAAKRHD